MDLKLSTRLQQDALFADDVGRDDVGPFAAAAIPHEPLDRGSYVIHSYFLSRQHEGVHIEREASAAYQLLSV